MNDRSFRSLKVLIEEVNPTPDSGSQLSLTLEQIYHLRQLIISFSRSQKSGGFAESESHPRSLDVVDERSFQLLLELTQLGKTSSDYVVRKEKNSC